MEYRLNKFISNSGYCSRREADRLIETGKVTVDGKRVAIGARVFPGQKVRVNGNLIEHDIEPVYIAFNKPVGVVSTTNLQEKGNIIEFIQHEQRIFPIGRLDKDSQGLILLTNDGDIVNKILRAGNNHEKTYIVTVNKTITKDFLTKMAHGVPILDRVTRKCKIEEINPYTFRISLIQGLNRQIRRMCEYLGYEVVKLERIQVMNITLDKLGQGNWRNLTVQELNVLFDLLEDSEKTATPVISEEVKNKKKPSNSINKDKPTSGKKNYEKGKAENSLKQNSTKENKEATAKPKSNKKKPSGLRNGKSKVVPIAPKPKRKYYQ